ncbi:hypothetical protein [Cystobacter ferrugineus]|uniref:Uncharacterized protein n=1 Tax=Cystobacter ferrugineus TaxID=83449 RepID=A0A1L9BAW5_9BACT|nr:hypothetical protein [Cystobacter ferrugineus]OJH39333.1 hypothetical protein BON30_17610 [Cystobacter ferrugineus]
MAKGKSKSEYAVPVESPELVAKRDRLLAALEKQANTAKGTAQPVIRKMYELLANTKVGAPFNMNLYVDVKNAFVRFMKDPVLPPPPIIMECVEFMQERLVSVGFSGQMEWPEGAPPVPAAFSKVNLAEGIPQPAKSAPAPKRARGAQDGFESPPRRAPVIAQLDGQVPEPITPKTESQQLDSFKAWIQSPDLGKTKG